VLALAREVEGLEVMMPQRLDFGGVQLDGAGELDLANTRRRAKVIVIEYARSNPAVVTTCS